MDIATGTAETHPSLLPLDPTGLPAVADPTPVTPVASGPPDSGPLVTGEMPTTAMFGEQAAAGTADAAAAMHAGMSAETDRRAHYAADILPTGAAYGDAMDIPLVPDAATPPAMSDLYPYAGQEPTPATVGFYHGDQPTLPE